MGIDEKKLGDAVFLGGSNKVRFLICLFARNETSSDWKELFRKDAAFFRKIAVGVDVEFELATEDKFLTQIKNSDVVFFSGGDSIPLYSTLARIGDAWTRELEDKTIIGSSAGADMLSVYCFDIQQNQIDRGLGLAPVKTIVHFGAKDYTPTIGWEGAERALDGYGKDLPLYTLREGEFVTTLA